MGARTRGVVMAVLIGCLPWTMVRLEADARPTPGTAADLIHAAITARLGEGAEVTIISVGLEADAPAFFSARLDPSARLGKPIRVALVTTDGATVPVTAVVRVVSDEAIARRPITRGARIAAGDFDTVRGEITNVPLRPLPVMTELSGSRALRAIAAGSVLTAADVALRRSVEPGDAITALAAAGAVEVSAELIAADGGNVGDVIRVVNPDTHRYLRGRVVKTGVVEVTDGR